MTDARLAQRPPAPDRLPVAVVDNHCHLDVQRDDAPFVGLQDVLAEAAAVGVDRIVQIGCDIGSARWTHGIVDEHRSLLGGVAVHPNEAPRHAAAGDLDAVLDEIASLARHPRIRVIGETGLDYYRTGPDGVPAQQESFRRHIALAKELDLVLQIHDRDAHDDVLRILAEEGAPERTVMHCFSGDMEMARECVHRGYYLSFAGTVTFRSARDLRNALAVTPVEQLLVETDAPYLTPTPHRGRANAPYLLPLTVRAMAETLSTSVPELCEALSATSETVYGPW
ncbi:AraC family transcriptional regulator [Ornithinimicrobium sp. CNJ-824]|uniref:TatD family hydrolase n=1 Tax=Ornithinimicrobium sp. CNJ-824 TaxID=1904966 RepID=UPI000965344C|nr:TatD family hydrolase [Ornithinimicrobium sp. CNJ-824]OLT22478.1 AraC family transcriptional regulator [Ornithinimicrobium sp. CNJ-824]